LVIALAALSSSLGLVTVGASPPAFADSTTLNGSGSSFAAPAVETWTAAVKSPPYSLTLNYTSSSSGQGRYEFSTGTVDFAVSDTGYVAGQVGTTPPSFAFKFIPITAAGVAFMYNVPGLTKNLQLSSYSACAVLTGAVTEWDDPVIKADNPGVALPHVTIRPVTESDTAGTNYVLEEWCIDTQPALWQKFAQQQASQSGGPSCGVPISANAPTSNWPCIHPNGLDESSTTAVAGDIVGNAGAIGAVQMQYAVDAGFGGSDPSKGVASVKNASGDYTLPKPVNVASALAYATQQPDGTHTLNFNGAGPNVYNPSTYSYLLTPSTGWASAKGATLSAFVNYVLTLGQQKAPSINYATLGLSLERYGVDTVKQNVPGAVDPTAAESAAYSCGDLTPADVQAGKTTPTCGVTNAGATQPISQTASNSSGSGAGGSGAGGSGAGSSGSGAGGSASGSGGSGTGVDPGVSLSGSTNPLAFTGGQPGPTAAAGAALAVIGWAVRRRLLRRRIPERAR
jgi:phosphate transport system substrate-binding protein